jgi:sugar lactone lactonase YvrE
MGNIGLDIIFAHWENWQNSAEDRGMKKNFTLFGILCLVFICGQSLAVNLSLTSSASYQTAINVTYSNPTVVGNTLQVTVQIQNTSGTWVYIQQNTTSTTPSPVALPYTVYLLGPGGTKTFNNVAFTATSYLEFDVTTPTGLNFQSLNPQCGALFGALTVDLMTRGLLTIPLPANAFDESPVNALTGDIDPLLDNVFSTLGNGIGSLVVDLKAFNWPKVATDAASLAADSGQVQSAVGQILTKNGFTTDQVNTFFSSASGWLAIVGEVLDFPKKLQLIQPLAQATFSAPQSSWNRFDVVATASAPSITSVSPSSFTGLPIGQTTLIRVIGSGFTGSPTLTFNDGVDSPFTGRVPTLVSANELDYSITTGTNQANWTVQVVNGAQTSNWGHFTVNAPSVSPTVTGSLVVNLSPAGAISAGAQWQVDGTGYNSSGQVVGYLTPGSHTVSFKPISGYTTPANQIVTINANAQTTASGTYSAITANTYTLALNYNNTQGGISAWPSASGNIYSAGSLVQLYASASSGYHFTGWSGNASGTNNPTTIVMNGNESVTASFALGDPNMGTVIVTIQPPEAAAAGVTWGFNAIDSNFHASGTSYTTFPQTYLVYLWGTNNWTGGFVGYATITAGQTTNYTFVSSYTGGQIVGNDPRTYFTLAGSAGNFGSADGISNAAQFGQTYCPVVDTAGNVFVVDNTFSTIRKITPQGSVSTFAGQAGVQGSADAAIGTNATFSNPYGLAIDLSNNLYVADTGNDTIRKITPSGAVSTLAGKPGNYGSSDGTGTGALFGAPRGIVVDTNGNVYIADTSNETIRKMTPAGVVTTLAGLVNSFGTADGTGNGARFNFPEGLAVDASGNIYVADSGNSSIRKVTPAGVVTTFAGFTGSGGAADGTGNTARFNTPTGIAIDAGGNTYVADNGNNAIRKVTQAGVVTTLAGLSGSPGSADGIGSAVRFHFPSGVAVDASGDLFITDSQNNTIRATQPLTTPVNQFITFAPLPNHSAGDAPFTLTATSSSELPVYLNVLSGPASLDTNNVLTILGGGTVTVVAWQPGNSNYNAATPVLQSFNVSQIPQTITFGALSQQKVGDAPFSLYATSDSGLPTSFSVSGPAVLNGNILTLTGWGTVTVTASQSGNASYTAATNVVQPFFVVPPDNTIVSPQRLPNGNFQLGFYGLMNTNYTVQTSTNLINWQTFTNFTGSNSVFYLNDSAATNFKQRFYRITP